MLCPACKNVDLVMADRQGIEIDYCPTCRGVWLDRGELDKLIERSVQLMSPSRAPGLQVQEPSRGHDSHPRYKDSDHRRGDDDHRHHGEHGQRKSFWRDLFD